MSAATPTPGDGRLGPRGRRPPRGWCGPGPRSPGAEADAVVAELRAGADRVHRAGARASPACAAEAAHRAGAGRRPAGLGPGQRRRLRHVIGPLVDKLQPRSGAPSALGRARSAPGSPALEVGALLGFLSSQGARPVRPVLGGLPAATADGGRLLLVAPNIVARRARAGRRPAPTSGSGCACTRRPTGCSSPRCRGCATTCAREIDDARRQPPTLDPATLAAMLARRRRAGSATLVRGDGRRLSLLDLFQTPEQREVLDRLTARDVAARGPRRRRDGRRRPRGDPDRGRDPRRKFNQRRKGAGPLDRLLRRLLGLDAKMRAVPRRRRPSSAASSTRSAWTASTRSGPSRANLPPRPRSRDPAAWVARVHG